MSDGDRFHREDPRRTQPRRNMTGTLRSEDPWKMRPDEHARFAGETAGFDERERPDTEFRDRSRRDGLDDAYRVADENMREGQWRAGSRNQHGYDWRSPGYGYGGYGSPFGSGYNSPFGYGYGGRPADGLLEQMVRVYMDIVGIASTMMNGLARPPYPPYQPPYRRPFEGRREPEFRHADDSPQPARSAAVRIEVTSNETHQVALDMDAMPPRGPLSVPPLRALNNGKPELRDIRFDIEGGRYVLRIHIPDGQPAGLYSGVVVGTRGQPCGTLAIRVGRFASDRGRSRSTRKS